MSMRRRVEKLEATEPKDPEPLVVVSRRRVVRPTPDGPQEVGAVTRTFRDGELVEEERKGVAGAP